MRKLKIAYYYLTWLKNDIAITLEFGVLEKLHRLIERLDDAYWSFVINRISVRP
jgi:hypothetical protein